MVVSERTTKLDVKGLVRGREVKNDSVQSSQALQEFLLSKMLHRVDLDPEHSGGDGQAERKVSWTFQSVTH